MITTPDFAKKQIVFVMVNEGEKLAFSNDNLVVKNAGGKVKFQCTCYRIFMVFVVGNCSFTSVIIQKAKKFGFFIALMTEGFKLYALIGAEKDGNTLLKRKQYGYDGFEIAKHITKNKIANQSYLLKSNRHKSESVKEAITTIEGYRQSIDIANKLSEIMAYEGLASKLYFHNHFNNILWLGRQPRLKRDAINSTLDIGYTLLFSFLDALLSSYGFDTYCGVMHRQYYMRKSLVCDFVEPFRPLIDAQIKKAINLKQFSENDFTVINYQYRLKWSKSAEYVSILMGPIIENKDRIFAYVQAYYRAFMKAASIADYPQYNIGGDE